MNAAHLLSSLACTAVLLSAVSASAQPTPPKPRPASTALEIASRGVVRAEQDTSRKAATKPTPARRPRARSQQRIRVQKDEARGILEQTRADSIESARRAWRDSVQMALWRERDSLAAVETARADSMAAAERARADSASRAEAAWRDSLARADAAAEARRRELARYRFGGQGWYVGVGGGGTAPANDLDRIGYAGGYDATVPIGWHRDENLFGVRVDLGYNQFTGRSFTGVAPAGTLLTLRNPDPQVLSATFNVTTALPFSLIRNVSPYLLAGGGFYHFRSYGTASALGGFLGNDVVSANAADNTASRNTGGIQGGIGIDWTVGTSAVYVESRFVNVFIDRNDTEQFRTLFGTNRSNNLQWVPIILGVKIR